MRKKKIVCNIISNIAVQVILAVSGLILPRLILGAYGSTVNGMINSVTQFLAYVGLVEMGVGNAAVIALYKPLAEQDRRRMSAVVSQARKKYDVSGLLYTAAIAALAFIYPFTVQNQLDYWFVFSMTLIIAASGMIDYFIIGKYKVFLYADQKYYILNIARCAAACILTVGSIILLLEGKPLIYVKGLAVLTHLGEAAFIGGYVRRCYPWLNFASGERAVIGQQKNSLVHQLCNMIVYNTDLIVLTLFLPADSLKEVSVYTVYFMPYALSCNLMTTVTNGMNASFGELLAKKETDKAGRQYNVYEYGYYIFLFFLYSCFIVLVVPFVACYTKGVDDVNYFRAGAGILFGLNGISALVKETSGVIINAAGHLKQTQKFVIMEALVNIIVSLFLIRRWGIEGVLTGTLVSHILADIGIIRYANGVVMGGSSHKTYMRMLRNGLTALALTPAEFYFALHVEGWGRLAVFGAAVGCINLLCILAVNRRAEKENFDYWLHFLKLKRRG